MADLFGICANYQRRIEELLSLSCASESEHIEYVDDDLTLKGLKIVYERNRAPRRGRK